MSQAKQLIEALKLLNPSGGDRVPVQVGIPREIYAKARLLADKHGLTWGSLVVTGLLLVMEQMESGEVKQDTVD